MTWSKLIKSSRRYVRDEAGASLIEYTVVIMLFLLVFFAILDFGRLGFNWVMTEKAMQRAARIAVVRPPVCAGVPETITLLGGSTADFGTLCRVGGVCEPVNSGNPQQCVLSASSIDCNSADVNSDTATEIWCILQPILPENATPQNIRMSYTYDQNLGFAGGPYMPMVEVGVVTLADELAIGGVADELRFNFITPLPALAAWMSGGGTTSNIADTTADTDSLADIPFPDLSVSMPGEDLNQGNNG